MRARSSAVLFFFLAVHAFAQAPPAADGFITRVVSASDFDVDGLRIVSTPRTHFNSEASGRIAPAKVTEKLFLGEPIKIYGKLDKKTRTLTATDISVDRYDLPKLSGTGIVDRLLPPGSAYASPSDLLLRADGYCIRIAATTKSTFHPPLTSLTDVGTNVWIKYSGKLATDSCILADSALFTQNTIHKNEDQLRKDNEYDPAAIDPDAEQRQISLLLLGRDPRQIPPAQDTALQQRVERIGSTLIPAYQRALRETDETRIHFRFQVVDQSDLDDTLALPSGIILIPAQLVARLQNDDQLAAILADSIARTLEKQALRTRPSHHRVVAAAAAGVALGPVWMIPAAVAAGAHDLNAIDVRFQQQSARVSLCLLHDAGYKLEEAPHAWWLLAPSDSADLARISIPWRALYLYYQLGAVWQSADTSPATTSTPAAAATAPHTP